MSAGEKARATAARALPPLGRVTFRGKATTRRTRAMVLAAERIAGFTFTITQGGYRGSSAAAASGSTHDREALDFHCYSYADAKRITMVRALKAVGFAVWFRDASEGPWPDHVHALPLGGDLSPSAAWQAEQYLRGRSGLTSNLVDNTWRPDPLVQWSYARGKAVPMKGRR